MPRYAAIALSAVAGALMLLYPPLQRHHFCVLLFWSTVGGFLGRRWTDGLFVPLIAVTLLAPFNYRGTHPVWELEVILITGPVFLLVGALGGFAGSWLSRRFKPRAEADPLNI